MAKGVVSTQSQKPDLDGLVSRCWWWNHAESEDPDAAAWETLRRTCAYGLFAERVNQIKRSATIACLNGLELIQGTVSSIRNLVFARKPPDEARVDWLPLGEQDPVLKWSELCLRGCDPDSDWLGLPPSARRALRMYCPILPRQTPSEGYARMEIAICLLGRDSNDGRSETINDMDWGASLRMKPLAHCDFRVLPERVQSETYVVVTFDVAQPTEALERQFKDELDWRLFPGKRNGQPCELMDCTDAGDLYFWHSDEPPENRVYPRLWQHTLDPKREQRTQERVVVIPGRQPPYAMCWIPARNDENQVQASFNNAIRQEHRSKILEACNFFWARHEIVPGALQRGPRLLPPWPKHKGLSPLAKRKRALRSEFWIGLTAYEFRKRGIRFDRSSNGRSAMALLREHGMPDDPDVIRPALSRFSKRLKEIDGIYRGIL